MSLHSCSKRQKEVRRELEGEKSTLSDLVDERNVEILKSQDTIEAISKKLEESQAALEKGEIHKLFTVFKW